MNIGIFSDTYYPQINGVATSIRMLEKEMNRRGHRVFIFTTTDPHATYAVPRVFRLPSMPLFFSPNHRVTLLYSPKLLLKMKQLDLDIIHTQTEFPMGILGKIVSEFYKIPMVHTYHTMYEDYVHYVANGHLITRSMAQKFSRIFCNRARAVIAPVAKTRDYLLESGVIRPIAIIPTGLDFEPFKQGRYSREELNNAKIELDILPEQPVIVSIGRVAKEKSIDVLIRALPALLTKLPTVRLLIVGDGPVREELGLLAEELGVRQAVVFAGAKPWEIIGKYYQLGDVFATASTSETQGLTYIEAMAAKTPVVVKMDKSIEGVLEPGKNGYCFEKDEDAAQMLYQALTNPEESARMAEEAYEAIQYFSAGRFASEVEALYKQVIEDFDQKKTEADEAGVLERVKHLINRVQ